MIQFNSENRQMHSGNFGAKIQVSTAFCRFVQMKVENESLILSALL